MLLQIYFDVAEENGSDFEAMYVESYVPAMQKQEGYRGSNLLRLFPPDVSRKINAAETEFNYQMELRFDTEENRQLWAASEEHSEVWPLAQKLARKVAHRGYDIARDDW